MWLELSDRRGLVLDTVYRILIEVLAKDFFEGLCFYDSRSTYAPAVPNPYVCLSSEELTCLETADPRLCGLHPAEPAAATTRLAGHYCTHGCGAEQLGAAHSWENGCLGDQRPPAPSHQPHAAHTGWRWQAGTAHTTGMKARAWHGALASRHAT